ncbi:MAG: Phage tail sheath protein [Methanomassiliicoccales archaeon PtaU1.Bin124]|nr:MAG: Phage tail sheath protein [Methanomassiliicoccales archaeon PtaU1.Bin124]
MPVIRTPGVYVEELNLQSKPIENIDLSATAFIGETVLGAEGRPVEVKCWNDFITNFGAASKIGPSVSLFFQNGGRKAYVIKASRRSNGILDVQKTLEGLEQVAGVGIITAPGEASPEMQQALIDHCERMHHFAILDGAAGADNHAVKEQRTELHSAKGSAALYHPWLKINDPSKGVVLVPPSGAIAGIYARSDLDRGVHKAPANLVVKGILGPERSISSAESEGLSTAGVNVVRTLPGRGTRVWGARTIADDPEWKYVGVRRTIDLIHSSITEGTKWAVFEPNDQRLWSKVSVAITDYLERAWRDGVLMGANPQEAFFVRCDRSTMTQNDIDEGRLVVLIGVAVQMPAEFVTIHVVQRTGKG